MSSLYEKIRPTTFSGLVGQEAVKKPLVKESINGKWFPVKMFFGVRGTGKTTVAKTVIMAANCLNIQENGDPCGVCGNCKAILADATTDFVELDAASNNSVEDARRMIEEMAFPPRQLRFRNYIIDECHMLSTSAFNALLKTCEHVPEHCLIIFCTTEFEKVPETLKSRSQKYEFMRLSEHGIAAYLAEVAKKEGIGITDEACAMIARRSDGVMRSALVDLETLADPKAVVTAETVTEAFGITEDETKFSFLEHLVSGDEEGCVSDISEYEKRGKNPLTLVNEMIETLKDIAIYKNSGTVVSSDEYHKQLDRFTGKSLRRINNLSMLLNDSREPLRYDPSIKTFFCCTVHVLRELEKIEAVPVVEQVRIVEEQVIPERHEENVEVPVTEAPKVTKAPEEFLDGFFEEDEPEPGFVAQASTVSSVNLDDSDNELYYADEEDESVGTMNEGFFEAETEAVPFSSGMTKCDMDPLTAVKAEKEEITRETQNAAPQEEDMPYFLCSATALKSEPQKAIFNVLRKACFENETLKMSLKHCYGKYDDSGLIISASDIATMSNVMVMTNSVFAGPMEQAKKYMHIGLGLLKEA